MADQETGQQLAEWVIGETAGGRMRWRVQGRKVKRAVGLEGKRHFVIAPWAAPGGEQAALYEERDQLLYPAQDVTAETMAALVELVGARLAPEERNQQA